jgi:pyruvate kinase
MELYGTLGASCAREETILALFRAGMTGARLNLSHTSLAQCAPLLEERFWPSARQTGINARLIVDLQGPELRIGRLERPAELTPGGQVALGRGGIPVPSQVFQCAEAGDQFALDDSALLLEVERAEPETLTCRVLRGGRLESRKSLAILGKDLQMPTLTGEDLENLAQAARFGVTDVLQPFVQGRKDILTLRRVLDQLGLERVRIMAKIENRQGLEHLDEIIGTADEICIARGDLGNSMPLWELPGVQKRIAARCRRASRPFCVVTQLLWSMQEREVPTRAEVCDIYNAVLDGAGALMLTGETAVGKHPVQAMEYLSRTTERALEDQKLTQGPA